jgi:hypothetical protein
MAKSVEQILREYIGDQVLTLVKLTADNERFAGRTRGGAPGRADADAQTERKNMLTTRPSQPQ